MGLFWHMLKVQARGNGVLGLCVGNQGTVGLAPSPVKAVFRRAGEGDNRNKSFAGHCRLCGSYKEGLHHLPRRTPAETLLWAVVQKHLNPLQFFFANSSK